jgi:hypothetical protein
MAEAVLKDLKEHRSNGAWEAMAVGFEVKVEPKREHYHSPGTPGKS